MSCWTRPGRSPPATPSKACRGQSSWTGRETSPGRTEAGMHVKAAPWKQESGIYLDGKGCAGMNKSMALRFVGLSLLFPFASLLGCAHVAPFQREHLADRIMDPAQQTRERAAERHWIE